MKLTRSFAAEQFARGLESWGWIGAAGKVPVFASAFGDVFFRADDGFWYLDTLEGSLTRVWADARALKADLATASGQDRYLLAGLAFGAESRGLIPDGEQVYDFKIPPVLGGALEVDNVQQSTSSWVSTSRASSTTRFAGCCRAHASRASQSATRLFDASAVNMLRERQMSMRSEGHVCVLTDRIGGMLGSYHRRLRFA